MKIKRFNEQNLSNIIFLGPPGSGKGTMTNLLKNKIYDEKYDEMFGYLENLVGLKSESEI